jgi:hypothetical protein
VAASEDTSIADARLTIAALPFTKQSDTDPLERVTFLIKTFERPCCVARLLVSIRKYFPGVLVRVCDDSRVPLFEDGAEPSPRVVWHTLDYDLGHTLGAGRNHLLAKTDTPFFFLLDDDHEITEATDVRAMLAFLERSGFDLVAGAQGRDEYGAAVFERFGPYIVQRFHKHHGLVEPRVVRCDRTSNTFLARCDAVRPFGWEPNVYANEHADFFLRVKAHGLRVAQMGGVYVEHDRRCEPVRGVLARISDRLVAHRDGAYRALRRGDEGFSLLPGRRAKKLYRKFVLEAHGARDIVDVSLPWERRALERLIGPVCSTRT